MSNRSHLCHTRGLFQSQRNLTNVVDKLGPGEWLAHIVFGFPYAANGFWCMFNVACRFVATQNRNVPYRSTSWFIWNRYPNTPVEPFLMTVNNVLIMFIFTVNNFKNGALPLLEYFHLLWYTFGLLQSVTQILQFYKILRMYGIDYACFMMNYVGSAYLMYYHRHLHGDYPVLVILHLFWVYAFMSCAVAIFFEAVFYKIPIFAMLRGLLIFLVGIHMMYIGFVIYPSADPKTGDLHSDKEITKVILGFGAEMAFIFIVGIGTIVFVQRYCSVDNTYVKTMLKKQHVTGFLLCKDNSNYSSVTKHTEKNFV